MTVGARISHEETLDCFQRGQIYGFIRGNPGAHYNEIRRGMGLNNGTAAYHIEILRKHDFIYDMKVGTRRHFYPTDVHLPIEAFNRHPRQRVLQKIEDNPGATVKELAAIIGKSQSTTSHHIQALVEEGLVSRERRGISMAVYPAAARA